MEKFRSSLIVSLSQKSISPRSHQSRSFQARKSDVNVWIFCRANYWDRQAISTLNVKRATERRKCLTAGAKSNFRQIPRKTREEKLSYWHKTFDNTNCLVRLNIVRPKGRFGITAQPQTFLVPHVWIIGVSSFCTIAIVICHAIRSCSAWRRRQLNQIHATASSDSFYFVST